MARTLVRRTPSIRLSVPRRALARGARAAGTAAAKAAASEKHTLAAVGAAAVYGYMRGRGVALPYVAALGQAGTYGLVTWALGRYTKSRTMQHVATGLLSVAAAEFAGAATPGAAPGAAAMGGEF
ncbi:MAG: hypothetical protein ACOYMM_11415 [Phycisphaerales bacterium]